MATPKKVQTPKKTDTSTSRKKKPGTAEKKNPSVKKATSSRGNTNRPPKAQNDAPGWQLLPGAVRPEALKPVEPLSLLTDFDIELFQAGHHHRLYEKLGSHILSYQGISGVYFAVWAPDAAFVSVIGNFNHWDRFSHTLHPRWDQSGIWEGFIPGLGQGELYKYYIRGNNGEHLEKGDPYANHWEVRPHTASIVWDLEYTWSDTTWMRQRHKINRLDQPISVYEVHLGSWQRPDKHNEEVYYSYQQITERLVPYVKDLGFTHVELMPVMEHPFDGSWGYQQTGYFAPTSRFGTPQQFMAMIDAFHREKIGVILDWVPSHFPFDAHGLYRFDGSHVYEYQDMRKGFQPDWNSYIFNYGRNEVRCFLSSNALFWLDKFHVDGLRVDAVSSMIFLDYSRPHGAWEPNRYGGRENLEALEFLRELNKTIYQEYPDVQTIAEESTSYYGVSKPVFMGGLGFGMKWMMGWMHDTLGYFKRDPYYRQWHQNQITFSILYAFSENFMLPLSHDEVVHGKSPLIYKMPGDEWQRFANLRLLYTYMFTHPGTKLLFMGGEFAQTGEWNYKSELQWELLQYGLHKGVQTLIRDLNALYKKQPALYEKQFSHEGFAWNDLSNHQDCVLIYYRQGNNPQDTLLVLLNMTPTPHEHYTVGVFASESWREIFNSDAPQYGGSGVCNTQVLKAHKIPYHGKENLLHLRLPPLAAVVLRQE